MYVFTVNREWYSVVTPLTVNRLITILQQERRERLSLQNVEDNTCEYECVCV